MCQTESFPNWSVCVSMSMLFTRSMPKVGLSILWPINWHNSQSKRALLVGLGHSQIFPGAQCVYGWDVVDFGQTNLFIWLVEQSSRVSGGRMFVAKGNDQCLGLLRVQCSVSWAADNIELDAMKSYLYRLILLLVIIVSITITIRFLDGRLMVPAHTQSI